MQQIVWLGLGYNVPINPSKNRVYVWRKLKEFGAEYFKQGVAVLPRSPQSLAKFGALAQKIRDMGGDATLIELRFLNPDDEAQIIAKFQIQSENEYQELIRDCAQVVHGIRENLFPAAERGERLRKIAKRYSKVKSRDYFQSRSRADIAGGLDELAGDMAHVTDEIARQFKTIFDL